jgi:hypothetical protein
MITKATPFTNADMMHRSNVRSVYRTVEGKHELVRMLADLGVFREITEDELPLRNYGIRKLEELGFLDIEMIEAVVDFLFRQPVALRPTIEEMGRYDDSPYGDEGERHA